MVRDLGFDLPAGYLFHPGHTWMLNEGLQIARVGVDGFTANLLGKIDKVEVTHLNRWVRQGQKVCTLRSGDVSVDMVSPVEGVVTSINHEAVDNPGLVNAEPYGNGWLCTIKAPDIDVNVNNLLRGTFVAPWMQNTLRRLAALLPQAAVADGGLPVAGALAAVDAKTRASLTKEFFLT